jgi:hypothetical protein
MIFLFRKFSQQVTAALPSKKRRRKVKETETVDEVENKEADLVDTAFAFDDGQDFGTGFNMDVDVGLGLQGLSTIFLSSATMLKHRSRRYG